MLQDVVNPNTTPGILTGTGSVTIPVVPALASPPSQLADRPFHYVIPTPLAGGTLQQMGMNTNFQGGIAFQGLAAGDLRTMSNRGLTTRNNIANSSCGGPYSAGSPQLVIGSAGQGGGFYMVGRYAYPFFVNDGVFFFGASPAVRAGGAAASGANNTICIGADTGDANLSIITRDNGGTITKSAAIMTKAALTTGDPTTNGARVLDFGLQCLPNGGAVTAWVYDVSNGAYVLSPTAVTLTLPLAGTALHISGAASTVGGTGRLDQEFMHFYGWW